jgi:signal transduction histidine kinase
MARPPRRLSISARFALPVAVVILVMGLSVALFVHASVRINLESELEERSRAMISELVQRSTPEAVRDDIAALELVVQDVSARPDVAYVVIIGATGRVLASSFSAGLPTDLVRLFERPRQDPTSALTFRSEQGVVQDHVGLLIDGRLGTAHLGLSQARIRRQAARQSHLVLAHTLGGAVIAAVLAMLTAHLVTKPLRALASAATLVGTDQPVEIPPIRRGDELGRLAQAFEDMVRRLEQNKAQIDAANRLVVQAERMAVVGQLSAGVAHEIGNPLHAGRQFLEGLRDNPEQRERYLGLLGQALARIDKVIGQLLSYSAERTLELAPTAIDDVIHQSIDFMRYDHRVRAVRLVPDIEPELPLAVLDPSVTQQVLVNLLVNALDALDGHGEIVVSAARHRDGRGRTMIMLAVEDDGPGVPESVAAQLFDPFFTTKEPGKGTGLGLSVSQELVAAQGGTLRYLPGASGGARFEILFPTQEEA